MVGTVKVGVPHHRLVVYKAGVLEPKRRLKRPTVTASYVENTKEKLEQQWGWNCVGNVLHVRR